MRLIEIHEKNYSDVEPLVANNGCFLQDFSWGDFQKSLGRNVFRFAVQEQNGNSAAQTVLYAQLIETSFSGHSYFFAPYGPVEADPARFQKHFDFFCEMLHRKFSKALFLRFEPRFSFASGPLQSIKKSANLNPRKTLILDLHKSADQLLAEMHPKTRYNIKVAQKNLIEIRTDKTEDVWQPLADAARRAKIREYGRDYYQKLANFFGEQQSRQNGDCSKIKIKVYTAWHQSDLLATNLMVYYNDTATYLFGGSANAKRNLMAPYLLHWQAIQDAKNLGLSRYDFWGVETDPNHTWAGISRFKTGFGGELKEYAGSYDKIFRPAWYNIYNLIRTLNRALRK